MKIMSISVFSNKSTNNSQANGFEHNGHTVIRYNYRMMEREIGTVSRDNDIILTVQQDRPDIVLFSKCNNVNINVVKECNKISKTVLWYMDPLNGNFNEELIQKIKHCNYSFFALKEPFNKAKEYSDKIHFLQEGFDVNVNRPIDTPYKHNVSFIGGLRNERQDYYDKIKFHNYTNVYGIDHSYAVCESKINLNFTEGGTSDRTYKVLASKGFLLTQPWEDIEDDFKIGVDLDIFTSIDTLKSKIDYYLNHENQRLQIAEHGYNTVQKFNRENWAKRLIEIVRKGNDTV